MPNKTTFHEIPLVRPVTPLLDQIDSPADLKKIPKEKLPRLAKELREFLLFSVGQTGGHFGAGLGVVELTIALHYCYNTPADSLVWDVGHQAYPHKILTGRREQMLTIRQEHGISGFPKRDESEYDTFGVGHSSTSISAALGMAIANKHKNNHNKAIAVIGDGAMTAGMAFEALHHAAHTRSDILVVLNDNNMSISHNVGGLSDYFSKIWASKLYTNFREGGKKVLAGIPTARELVKKTEEHMKGMVSPATFFEEMGFYYIGVIDGHDIGRLIHDLQNLRELPGPKLLHIMTQKGKGFAPAEQDPVGYHALNKIEPKANINTTVKAEIKSPKYQQVFGDWLCDMAKQDVNLQAITPAMCDGSGMVRYAELFPQRFYDVAIAEQHAVTLAAGMACGGQKPIVAIYSTFLQRGYDQLIHDVAIQNLDVTFAIDRAGLVGEDGPTHSGNYDLSYLRCIPNLLICAPSDENECRQLLTTAYQHKGPAAVRYPRGTGTGVKITSELQTLPVGKGKLLRQGKRIAILNFGTLLPAAAKAAENLNASLCDMRFVKPLDEELILSLYEAHDLLVTLEENTILGGAGSSVGEFLSSQSLATNLLFLGLPDRFIDHAKHSNQLAHAGLNAEGIEASIRQRLQLMDQHRPSSS
jgi:1-deoxy-D-xylulose-5-phosphate synthase